nr:proline-rich protein 2 isoform X2 [Oryctolagus cuniculus]
MPLGAGFSSDGAPGRGARPPEGSGRGLPKWAQLCKPRPNSPRRGGQPLPAAGRFQSSHPQTQSTSLRAAAAAAAATRARPPPRRPRALPPGSGTRRRARCKRCGRRTIPRRGAHNHRPPGPAARTAREWGAPGGPQRPAQAHLSGGPRPPPPHSPSPSPALHPGPLGPGRSPLPRAPSPASALEGPLRPPPRNPSPPPPQPQLNGRRQRREEGAAAQSPDTARSPGSGPDSVPERATRRRRAAGLRDFAL